VGPREQAQGGRRGKNARFERNPDIRGRGFKVIIKAYPGKSMHPTENRGRVEG